MSDDRKPPDPFESIAQNLAGVVFAQNMVINFLVEEKVIDKAKFMEHLKQIRSALPSEDDGGPLGAAILSLSRVVAQSGDGAPPRDWLTRMLPKRE